MKCMSAFVTPMGKFGFWKVPFGLAEVSTYFKWLVNEVLSSLDFVCGYLDGIMIYRPYLENHLIHTEIVFQCLLKPELS